MQILKENWEKNLTEKWDPAKVPELINEEEGKIMKNNKQNFSFIGEMRVVVLQRSANRK